MEAVELQGTRGRESKWSHVELGITCTAAVASDRQETRRDGTKVYCKN